ncbi:hypothetical protein EAF04_002699 [Stromatinia cepivora]|nr:hypothetical protein EAF04_002699 [Stromatinia cepivora]
MCKYSVELYGSCPHNHVTVKAWCESVETLKKAPGTCVPIHLDMDLYGRKKQGFVTKTKDAGPAMRNHPANVKSFCYQKGSH